MRKQKEKKPRTKKINNYTALISMLILSFCLNVYLFTKTGTVSYEEPKSVQEMSNKYKELLTTKNEKDAQEELINWLKNDKSIISAGRFNNGFEGLNFDYCLGSRAYGENSWQNLKAN